MANPYNMGAYPQNYYNQAYGGMNPQSQQGNLFSYYSQPQQKSIGVGLPLGAITTGLVGGGAVGYFKYRTPVKDGTVNKAFAKQVYEKHTGENLTSESKRVEKQVNNILSKIDKVKNKNKLIKLLEKNKEALPLKEMGVSYESYITSLGAESFEGSKTLLKNTLLSRKDMSFGNIKDSILACWDKKTKSFIKPKGLDSALFEVIESTKNSLKWKKALKYGGITAGILGALSLGTKIMAPKNQFIV